jgi:hypothetical protein
MTTERSPRQIRLLTALLLFGTFLFGAVAGVGLSQWNHRLSHPPRPQAPFLPGPPGALNLTPVQEAKAHEITERYRPQLEAILRANFPKVQALIAVCRKISCATRRPSAAERESAKGS